MSLKQYSKEDLQEMSFIEIAYELLEGNKQPISFKEIMDEIKSILGLSEDEVKSRIAQFYTDLNIDGRFLALGENRWGLRVWYPVDQIEDEVVAPVKPKKKKAKKVVEEEEELVSDFEDLEEDELDFDDIDEFEEDEDDSDDDLLADDDDELDDEDFDDSDDELLKDEEYELEDEELDDEELDLDEEEEDK